MVDVNLVIRAYLYEAEARYIRGLSAQAAPSITDLAQEAGVNANYLTRVLSGDGLLSLSLLWRLLIALQEWGLEPSVEDAIYWPPLHSARPLDALDTWRPDPVVEVEQDEPRLHVTLDAYLGQMRHVAGAMGEPLIVPSTRSLAEGVGMSRRTIQRLRADELKQVNREILGGIVAHFYRLGINVRPAQLIVEPAPVD